MPNQPTSFRYPFVLPAEVHEGVRNALRLTYNGVVDLNQAIRALNTKVNANTSSITTVQAAAVAAAVAPPAPPAAPLFLSFTTTIPAATILALKATPLLLLSAPGLNSMYAPCLVVFQYKFVTTPYTVNASGNQYLCLYAGTQPTLANLGNAYANLSSTGFMDQGASQVWMAPPLTRGAQTVFDNQPLMMALPSDATAELLAGDGTLTVTVEYAVVALS